MYGSTGISTNNTSTTMQRLSNNDRDWTETTLLLRSNVASSLSSNIHISNQEMDEQDYELKEWMKRVQFKAENDARLELRTKCFSSFDTSTSASAAATQMMISNDDTDDSVSLSSSFPLLLHQRERKRKDQLQHDNDSEIKRHTQQVLDDISNNIEKKYICSSEVVKTTFVSMKEAPSSCDAAVSSLVRPGGNDSSSQSAICGIDDSKNTTYPITELSLMKSTNKARSYDEFKLHEIQSRSKLRLKAACFQCLKKYCSLTFQMLENFKDRIKMKYTRNIFRALRNFAFKRKGLIAKFINRRKLKIGRQCFNSLMVNLRKEVALIKVCHVYPRHRDYSSSCSPLITIDYCSGFPRQTKM